jgi:hypothetical protein
MSKRHADEMQNSEQHCASGTLLALPARAIVMAGMQMPIAWLQERMGSVQLPIAWLQDQITRM